MQSAVTNNPILVEIVVQLMMIPESGRYWQQFRSLSNVSPEKFAVIKVSGECVANSANTLGRDAAVFDGLGLRATFVHGYGKALTQMLNQSGIETGQDDDGDRITDERLMPYVVQISREFGSRLVAAIESYGAKA